MTFPVVELPAGETIATSGSTAPVVNLPDNSQPGDILLLFGRVMGAEATPITLPASPAWTDLGQSIADNSNDRSVVAWRRVDGTEGWGDTGNTITLTTSTNKSVWIILRITGASLTQDPAIASVVVGTGFSPNPPSLTPSGGSKDYLWIASASWDGGASVAPISSNPSGYTDAGYLTTGLGGTSASNGELAVAYKQAAAASEDPGTFEIGGSGAANGWTARTLAIYPVEAAAFSPGRADEADLASALAVLHSYAIGSATESDLASAPVVLHSYVSGSASESDLAEALGLVRLYAVGSAAESDLAQTLGFSLFRSYGLASETDLAQARAVIHSYAVGSAAESDLAQALGLVRLYAIGSAAEADLAVARALIRLYAIGSAAEADLAVARAVLHGYAAGTATESDLASALAILRLYGIGRGDELDLALPLAVASTTKGDYDFVTGVHPRYSLRRAVAGARYEGTTRAGPRYAFLTLTGRISE